MTRSALVLAVLAAAAVSFGGAGTGCAHFQGGAARAPSLPPLHLDYAVRFIPAPLALEVEVRLTGPARPFLFTRPGEVAEVRVHTDDGEGLVPVRPDGRVNLPADARRLSYRYETGRLGLHRFGDLYTGVGDAHGLLVAGRSYLIRPRVADRVTATLRVEGASALLPWAPGEDGRSGVDGAALVDSGFHGFNGRRCTRTVETTTLEVALLGGPWRVSDDFLCDWVAKAAMEALTLRRPLPYARLTVHLVPAATDEASALGLLLWSAPPSLALTVGTGADEEAFARDWVALHELVHVLHPSFPGQPPWLSEGLSTYLTEVARMRSGRHSEEEGWGVLARGFAKGREEADGQTLEEAVEGLRRGVYLPVYWAGALLCLEVDVELRRATQNRHALEDVLEALLREGPSSTVNRFGEVVDALAGRPLFEEVLARHTEGQALARAQAVLSAMGIRSSGDGVTLEDAPLSQVRAAITAD